MKVPIKCGMKGRFKFTVRDGETLEVKRETDWMENLILDAGLNRMGTGAIVTHCQVGTSSVPPSVGQTALVALVGATSIVQSHASSAQPTPTYYFSNSVTYRFGVGVAAGNLSEVGVGWATSGSLWSRALIVDGFGVPTTITVLSTEVLDVTYQLQIEPNVADVGFNISIGGILRTCVLRPANIIQALQSNPGALFCPFRGIIDSDISNSGVVYSNTIGAITAAPTGTSDATTSRSWLAYSNNSYKRVLDCVWGLNDGNMDIEAVKFGTSLGQYQISFSPPIAKTNVTTLVLDFEITWARL